MDAVKLSCHVDVAVQAKLMGSDGCGGVRVSTNKAESNCETARGVNSSIERCGASISKKDAGSGSSASDSSLWRKLIHSHDFLHERLTRLCIENSSEPPSSSCKNGLLPNPSLESGESHRKAGKVSRSSGGASKRSKVALLDDTMSSPRDNDIKDTYELGSTHLDKPQMVKQRNSCSGKRGDKRNSKVPAKTFQNFNSASGENAFFGAYGLKPEINDVTKLVEDLSLNELLEGSYQFPSLGKDKAKKVEDANGTFLTLVRNVWSVLPTPRPIQSQNTAESDGYAGKMLGSPSSIYAAANGENSDNRLKAPEGDLSSSSKDHSIKAEIPSTPLSFPLCEASDVLRHLVLPPSKDLDSLLQDASKPPQYSKNNSDPRSGKLLPRIGLPHFPWSHAFNGNCRTNSEAAKLLTSRSLCQGPWLRIGNAMSSPGNVTYAFINLESLTFNESLVPSQQKQTIMGNGTSLTISGNPPRCHCASASVATLDKASRVSQDPGVRLDVKDDALHCPRLLAAAQTLYDIAIQSQNHNPNGILRWPKKLSQKSMRARKSKSIEKPEEAHATTTMSLDPNSSNNHVRKDTVEQTHPKPSKRPKLSTMDNNQGSPSSSATESERRHFSASKIKQQSCIMLLPPSTRTPENPSACQQKARKFLCTD